MSVRRVLRTGNLLLFGLGVLAGCRGEISEKPPIHPVLDMDFQPKLKPQSESKFERWTDHRGMRGVIPGTVWRPARRERQLRERYPNLEVYKRGDAFVTDNPLPKSAEVVARGREVFEITCAACHGRSGKGGMVARRWSVPVPPITIPDPNQTDEKARRRILEMPDGQVFGVITNGKGTMPSYAHQIPVADRWAVVHYLRVLQLHLNP